MREIKFRAWNNKFKEFKFMSLIKYLGGRGIMDDWADSENSVWEQYTGLKDKNCVEIYENDIVYIPLNQAAYLNNTKAKVSYSEHGELLAGNVMLSRVYPAVEVIGNIHENADLLEDN